MLSKNQLGFLYMFLSVCAFSLMDIIVKWSVNYPIGQVLFFRGFFGIIFYFFVIGLFSIMFAVILGIAAAFIRRSISNFRKKYFDKTIKQTK